MIKYTLKELERLGVRKLRKIKEEEYGKFIDRYYPKLLYIMLSLGTEDNYKCRGFTDGLYSFYERNSEETDAIYHFGHFGKWCILDTKAGYFIPGSWINKIDTYVHEAQQLQLIHGKKLDSKERIILELIQT
jgi:hypothetical protein